MRWEKEGESHHLSLFWNRETKKTDIQAKKKNMSHHVKCEVLERGEKVQPNSTPAPPMANS